jgi:hypothetical protein
LTTRQSDFSYDSSYWTSNETYAVEDGLEGLTEKQTKLASYGNTPFENLCLGMKVKNVTKWIEVHHRAISLYDVVANEMFKQTKAGKNTWKSLIGHSSMQNNCNKEGFNFINAYRLTYVKIRIGLVANNEYHCNSPDSCIGFGISSRNSDGVVQSTSCGNLRYCCLKNSGVNIAAYGLVLIK